jgi:diphthamide synthase (EF-2-diphthine--ammonia ligase)
MIQNLEIHQFKEYTINFQKVNKIFNIFNECVETLEELHIEYAVTGSIGLILNTNKIYRYIKDIDFIILEPLYSEQLSHFLKKGFEFRSVNFNTISLVKNFVLIEFHSKYIRLHDVIQNCKKINYNNYFLNILSIEDIFNAKKIQGPIRQKDLDDIEFFSKFV